MEKIGLLLALSTLASKGAEWYSPQWQKFLMIWPFWPGRKLLALPCRTPVELVDYFRDTRHPVSSLLVVAPLLALYEAAVAGISADGNPSPRNGADAWIRNLVPELGQYSTLLPPLAMVVVLAILAIPRWRDFPSRWGTLCFGLVAECLGWSLVLWGVSLGWPGIVKNSGVELSWFDRAAPQIASLTPLIGAGIYEEFLFRLVALGVLNSLASLIGVGGLAGWMVAAVVSSWFFAAVHHWGPQGQQYSALLFSFRFFAGLCLCFLTRYRGFSIAVGTHFLYNLIIGLRPMFVTP